MRPDDLLLLKLDIDAGMRRPTIGDLMRWLRRAGYRPEWMMEKRSRSGKGWHIMIATDPAPSGPMEVAALQAILGSDPNREACNCFRARVYPKVPRCYRGWWNVLYR